MHFPSKLVIFKFHMFQYRIYNCTKLCWTKIWKNILIKYVAYVELRFCKK